MLRAGGDLGPWALVAAAGAALGAASQLRWVHRHGDADVAGKFTEAVARIAGGGVLGALLVVAAVALVATRLSHHNQALARALLIRRLSFALAPLSLSLLGPAFALPSWYYTGLVGLSVVAAVVAIRKEISSAVVGSVAMPDSEALFVLGIFFASGFAALIYQIVWQRALFTIFGSNVESVSLVVTAFMLGLGLGSLVGGFVSRLPRLPLVLAFGVVEIGIGVFGLVSLDLFAYVGAATLNLSFVMTGLVTFLLVLVPTLLMGSTLPLLVQHFVARWQNVGKTVGTLYFINTLGSAIGAIAVAAIIFEVAGMRGAVLTAAVINFVVGMTVILRYQQGRAISGPRS
jgi:hypothetical protein